MSEPNTRNAKGRAGLDPAGAPTARSVAPGSEEAAGAPTSLPKRAHGPDSAASGADVAAVRGSLVPAAGEEASTPGGPWPERIEAHYGVPCREILERLYVDLGFSAREIAVFYRVTVNPALRDQSASSAASRSASET